MAKLKKFYVVWTGAKPGIYPSWPEANAQVAGFPGARFKSFASLVEAEKAYRSGASTSVRPATSHPSTARPAARPPQLQNPGNLLKNGLITPSLSVDAACSGNPGRMEYQGVDTQTKSPIFHQAFELGTNNIGEFLALVHGLAWCKANGHPQLPIYSDSKIALGWIAKKKCKTTLFHNAKTAKVHDLIERGEAWLSTNTYQNPLLKWPTERWGEIPADFGRK